VLGTSSCGKKASYIHSLETLTMPGTTVTLQLHFKVLRINMENSMLLMAASCG